MANFITTDGLSLHFTDQGTGLPLLCLPGLTRTGADFRYVAPHLTGCRLITMDMRGRGASDRDPNWQNYNLLVECRDILELLDHLELERVAILGTSRGGLQAMGIAANAPDRLSGVALNDVGPVLDPAGMGAIMTYLGRRPSAKTFEDAASAMEAVSVGFRKVPGSRWMEEARLHFIEKPDGLDITYDPDLRLAVEAALAAPPIDLWPFFDALSGVPTCLIWGNGSNLLSEDTCTQMRARRPDMVFAEVPDRGHVPFLDEPASLSALNSWLDLVQ